MQDLNEFIEHKYFENQKIEDKSKAVEARILALEGLKKSFYQSVLMVKKLTPWNLV